MLRKLAIQLFQYNVRKTGSSWSHLTQYVSWMEWWCMVLCNSSCYLNEPVHCRVVWRDGFTLVSPLSHHCIHWAGCLIPCFVVPLSWGIFCFKRHNFVPSVRYFSTNVCCVFWIIVCVHFKEIIARNASY